MRPLVFATRNPGKIVELRLLLPGLAVLDLDEAAQYVRRAIPEVVEDADTFLGNARKKAFEVAEAAMLPALADDSGLEVDALGGAPGVWSARYAGPDADADANNAKLLEALAGVLPEQRTARFRAALAFSDVAGELGAVVITAEGVCEGVILDEPRGTGGFGYDPLFLLPELGLTMAELSPEEKNQYSHRAQAVRAIERRLFDYLMK